jgi:hypothetical protein
MRLRAYEPGASGLSPGPALCLAAVLFAAPIAGKPRSRARHALVHARNRSPQAGDPRVRDARIPPLRVLAVDVGGSHVKALLQGEGESRRFKSSPRLTAAEMVERTIRLVDDWQVDCISLGVPALVVHGQVVHEPVNLGNGWVGFDFQSAFDRPTKVVNDAVMQAIGSYEDGRMLFLGLGTGLGSAFIVEGKIETDGARPSAVPQRHLRGLRRSRRQETAGTQTLARGRPRHDRSPLDCPRSGALSWAEALPKSSRRYRLTCASAITSLPSSAGFVSGTTSFLDRSRRPAASPKETPARQLRDQARYEAQ